MLKYEVTGDEVTRSNVWLWDAQLHEEDGIDTCFCSKELHGYSRSVTACEHAYYNPEWELDDDNFFKWALTSKEYDYDQGEQWDD